MTSKYLEAMETLEKRLPRFPPGRAVKPGFMRHTMECGESLSWDLIEDWQFAEADNFLWLNTNGTRFPWHAHKEREWLIVFRGSMTLIVEDPETGETTRERLVSGTSRIIEPETPHCAEFLEDCYYFAICIPRNPTWHPER